MKIVVISPHRDDAAFSLGLSVEHWLHARGMVQVLNCFTQSDYAPFSDAGSLHRNDRTSFVSAVRKREDLAWNKLLGGRFEMTDLDLLDAPLRLVCEVSEAFTSQIRAGDRAVARVAGAIGKLARNAAPGGLAVVLPLAVGGHIDHRVVQQAGLDALAGSAVPVAFYEDLPYAARPGAEGDVDRAVEAVPLALHPVFAMPALPEEAQAAAIARKRRFAECYDSQVDSEVGAEIAAYAARFGARERLWANKAWAGAELAAES